MLPPLWRLLRPPANRGGETLACMGGGLLPLEHPRRMGSAPAPAPAPAPPLVRRRGGAGVAGGSTGEAGPKTITWSRAWTTAEGEGLV